MKKLLLTIIIKVLYWMMTKKRTYLTEQHLIDAGWVKEGQYYTEPMIKARDRVWVEINNHWYRVRHGENKTFVALECSVEWLEMYMFLLDKHQIPFSRKILK